MNAPGSGRGRGPVLSRANTAGDRVRRCKARPGPMNFFPGRGGPRANPGSTRLWSGVRPAADSDSLGTSWRSWCRPETISPGGRRYGQGAGAQRYCADRRQQCPAAHGSPARFGVGEQGGPRGRPNAPQPAVSPTAGPNRVRLCRRLPSHVGRSSSRHRPRGTHRASALPAWREPGDDRGGARAERAQHFRGRAGGRPVPLRPGALRRRARRPPRGAGGVPGGDDRRAA